VHAAIVAAAALALSACHRNGTGANSSPLTAPVTVTVRAAKIQDLRDTVVAEGAIAAAPSAIFTVIAPETSKIAELPNPEGSTVQPGDILARFDMSEATVGLGAKASDIAAASRKLDEAKATMATQQGLYDKGYTPRNTYEAAKNALAAAQTAYDQLQAQSDAAGALNERAIVRAPFAGVVAHVFKNVGDSNDLSGNANVLQLVDPTRVQAAVQVTPSQELRIVPGLPATITDGATMATQPGTVVMAPPVMAPDGAPSIEVRLSLSGAMPPALGTPVKVEIVVEHRDRVVVLPENTIAKDDTGSYVMIAGADGRAHRRDVKVGLVVSHLAEIQSGITEGDEVIADGLDQVSDNAPIQIDRNR
jgi:RND family efflux transporter MFP subunit